MAERIKALEATNTEIYGCVKGLVEGQRGSAAGMQDLLNVVKTQKNQIQELQQSQKLVPELCTSLASDHARYA